MGKKKNNFSARTSSPFLVMLSHVRTDTQQTHTCSVPRTTLMSLLLVTSLPCPVTCDFLVAIFIACAKHPAIYLFDSTGFFPRAATLQPIYPALRFSLTLSHTFCSLPTTLASFAFPFLASSLSFSLSFFLSLALPFSLALSLSVSPSC